MRRALVIFGDVEFGNAIKNGVESNNRQYSENPKIGVRAATGFKDWKSEFYGIYDKYGFADDYHQPNIVLQKVLLAWALLCDGIYRFYAKMAAKNRS